LVDPNSSTSPPEFSDCVDPSSALPIHLHGSSTALPRFGPVNQCPGDRLPECTHASLDECVHVHSSDPVAPVSPAHACMSPSDTHGTNSPLLSPAPATRGECPDQSASTSPVSSPADNFTPDSAPSSTAPILAPLEPLPADSLRPVTRGLRGVEVSDGTVAWLAAYVAHEVSDLTTESRHFCATLGIPH
jgi:hypothetical protein